MRTFNLRFVLLPLVLLCVVACALWKERETPQHGWWKERGPVVPHDSFPADCSLCHLGADWKSIRADFEFDHLAETGVELEGAHAKAECLRCHNDRGPVAQFAQRGCAGCHEDVHLGELGSNCGDCHDPRNWEPGGEIATHARTRFPLIGAHAAVACWQCHPGAEVGRFEGVSVECASCHQAALLQATDPDHLAAGFTQDCDRCHLPTTWTGAGFVHPLFALTGAHAAADCSACHMGGTFSGLPSDCFACHTAEYNATSDPAHALAGFSTDCQNCHNTIAWEGAIFLHTGITSGCVQCHQPDYNATSDPNHQAAGFPTSCEQCHVTSSWMTSGFNHTGITSGCDDCHLPDYQATTDPNHQTSGFPTSCEQCHVTSSWMTNGFNHTGITSGCNDCHLPDYQTTTDPNHALAGVPTTCEQCHVTTTWSTNNVNHAGIVSGCNVCHLADYQSTNDPNHQAAGFPITCQTCHSTNSWNGATFNHSFPINSGAHKNLDCADCHLVPTNYANFSCIDCHEHNQSSAGNDHDDVGGYVWSSPACYNCHPDGKD